MHRQLMFNVIAARAVAATSVPVFANDTLHWPEAAAQAASAPAPQGNQGVPGGQGMMGMMPGMLM